jgi:hypothetical protein
MGNRQTNRFVQVCGTTDQKEQVPRPRKSGLRREIAFSTYVGRAKEEKDLEVKHARHIEVGQDKELYPTMLSQGEALHSTSLNTVPITQNHGEEPW